MTFRQFSAKSLHNRQIPLTYVNKATESPSSLSFVRIELLTFVNVWPILGRRSYVYSPGLRRGKS
jgi:hypothetical protein